MIRPDQLRNLVVVTALLLIAAIWVSLHQDAASPDQLQGDPLLPGLSSQISDLGRLELQGKDDRLTLALVQEVWVVRSLGNYPADLSKVRSFVQSLVLARRLAPKSSNVDLFERMGLAEGAIALKLFTKEDESIVALDLGKRRLRPQESESETFVFRESDGRAWTVTGLAEASTEPLDWIDRSVVAIDGQRIREVSLRPVDGTSFLLSRVGPKAEKSSVTTADGEIRDADEFRAERLLSGLAELRLEDLLAVSEIPAEVLEIAVVRYTTFDGLVINLRVLEIAGTSYVRLAALYDETLVVAEVGEAVPAGTTPADQEAVSLNSLWQGWAYKVSSSRLSDLLVKQETLAPPPNPAPVTEDND